MKALIQRLSIASKLTAINLAAIVVLAVSIGAITSIVMRDEIKHQTLTRLEANMSHAWQLVGGKEGNDGGFRISNDKLYSGSLLLNDNTEIVDSVSQAGGGYATIFMGDTRVATTIRKQDGSRATGTKLAAGSAYDAIFREGRSYRGKADILLDHA